MMARQHGRIAIRVACALALGLGSGLFARRPTPQPLHAQGAAPAAPAAAQVWSPNQRVFGDLGISMQSEPAIAASNGQMLTAWTDERNTQPDIYALFGGSASDEPVSDERERGVKYDNSPSVWLEPSGRAFAVYSTQDDIVLARREAGASGWLSHTLMSTGNDTWYSDARRPALAMVGNSITVVWQDYRNRNWDIYAARCDPNAMTCQANVKVSDATDESWQSKPRIAVFGTSALAVWEDDRAGAASPHLYASYSGDGGATWGASGRVDLGDDPATSPAIAYDAAGAPWVAWERHPGADLNAAPDIYVAKFDGVAWVAPQRVDGAPVGKRALNPRIAASGAGMAVAWEDYRDGNLVPRIYTAQFDGAAWHEMKVQEHSGAQTRPALAAASAGSGLYLAWQDTRNGQPDVYTARWDGTTWANVAQVNANAERMAKQYHPHLVPAGNGDLYLTWLDTRSYAIKPYLSQYLYASNAWSAPIPVPIDGSGRYGVDLDNVASALDGAGHLHVMWTQDSDLGVQVFHSQYINGAWSGVIQASDTTTSTTYRPRMQPVLAARGNKVAATWIEWDTGPGWPYPTKIFAATFDGAQWQQSVVSQGQIQGDPKPSVAVDDAGNVYVAWSDQRWINNGLRGDIVVSKQAAGGGAWSAPVRVNGTPSAQNYCFNERPQLASAGAGLHITWAGCVPWTNNVFYSASSDGGATWAPSTRLARVGADSVQPALAVGPGEVSVVYASTANSDTLRFYAASLQGSQWLTDTQLSDGPTAWNRDEDGAPSVVYDPGSNGYVAAWVDHRLRDVPQIYFSKTGSNFEVKAHVYLPLAQR